MVVGVPHAGNHFIFEHLMAGMRPEVDHVEADRVCKIRDRMRGGTPAIVPMRHPREVARSWVFRGYAYPQAFKLTELSDCWRRLVTGIDPLGPLYLPLDADDRDDWLEQINTSLGLNLSTDWPHWKKGPEVVLRPSHERLVEDVMSELGGFFKRFGYA